MLKKSTQDTIDKIYPDYYPVGAVNFFKTHHNDKNIYNDIENKNVYLLFAGGKYVATVTIKENHILRLFVLKEYQRKGYGKELLDFAERTIFENYTDILIDASFPAKHIYLKRGYVNKEYHTIKTDNVNYLCYDVMSKSLCRVK